MVPVVIWFLIPVVFDSQFCEHSFYIRDGGYVVDNSIPEDGSDNYKEAYAVKKKGEGGG